MNSSHLSLGIVQENPIVGDIKGNLSLAKKTIERILSKEKVDVILFTEMFITGYPPEDLILRDDLLAAVETALVELSKISPETHIVMGYPKKVGQNIYNSAGVLHNNEVVLEYHKQELPNYEVFDEKRYFSPGKGPGIFEIGDHKLALTVCEDIWHTKAVRQASRRGADLILNLNASPFHLNKLNERKEMISSHSQKYKLPIVYINQVGGQDELVFDGTSMVMDKNGQQAVQLKKFESESRIVKFKKSKGSGLDILDSDKLQEENELEDVYNALVLGAKDYIEKNGFPGVLIGSSGGIDSALTATIATDAIGPNKVKTYMMPFKFTSDISVHDAEELAKNLKIEHHVLPIKDIYNSFYSTLEEEFTNKEPDITEENLQSRCRGVLLMGLSNKSGDLVLTTGNKSETAVGYSTLYGDTAGGFAVLKDVPKTLVYRLAEYRNTLLKAIPQRIIDRPPTAELSEDQKDSDSLPDYDVLDRIIEMYVEQDESKETIIEQGFNEQTVERVIKLIDFSEYKRRQAPLGVKITPRGFGKDRRYPITNKFFK
jgi:NAD+ synthase (glutamine-hydrolysing)